MSADLTEGSGPAAAALRQRLAALIPEGWIDIDSSWLAAIRYHPDQGSFDIRLRNGREYPNYPNCSPAKFLDFLSAPSHGSWMAQNYPPRNRG